MRILVVDDESTIRRTLSVALESMGHTVATAGNGAQALEELRAQSFEAVLLDLRLSHDQSGLDLLQEILRLSPRAAVVLMTAFASIETAVEAMRRGAFDYLPKPCTPDQVRAVLARIKKTRKLENKVVELESRLGAEGPPLDLGSSSPTMRKAAEVAFKAADSDATILLLGESGTGKSVLAHAVHERSPRVDNAFVTVSCPSLSRELLESELFGHVKGAFTGAVAETWGKVAAADGGTLFLDEIGELPLEIQAKLLRLLQEREYERLGETKPRRANVRVISATNRDLSAAVTAGKFREDLYYRLNVISVRLPALRERPGDIEPIARQMLEHFAARLGKPVKDLAPEALLALQHYPWPGNIRELRNVIERAVILTSGDVIESDDLAENVQGGSEIRLGGAFTLEQVESEHIRRVVAQAKTLEQASEILGIDPATLYRRRKKLE